MSSTLAYSYAVEASCCLAVIWGTHTDEMNQKDKEDFSWQWLLPKPATWVLMGFPRVLCIGKTASPKGKLVW